MGILSLIPPQWIAGGIAIIAAIIGVFGYGAAKKRQGKTEAKGKAQVEDYEHAESIRNRVRDNRADRLRQYDDAGWRD